jgi:unsaturated rhamnogalacturonyl hydrolase
VAIPSAIPAPVTRAEARTLAVRMARSVMQRNPQAHRRWDYTQGVILGAIEQVGLAMNSPRLLGYVRENMDRWVRPDGSIVGYEMEEHNLDHVAQGTLLFGLAARTGDARYMKAAATLREQLRTQPRTPEGGFWHKRIYPQQMWLDGLYMAEPFYARYATVTRDTAAFTDIAKQFLLVSRYTRDSRTGLMYHAWDAARAQPWADSLTGLSRNFWGRAMGWYLVGVVETLDHFPAGHPGRAAIIETFRQAAAAVVSVQDPVTGLWWDVLDQPNREGNYLEASASSMFAYALAKGARLGYLEPRYRDIAARALGGIRANLLREQPDGTLSLVNIVAVSGLGGSPRKDGSLRDGTFGYYVSEPVVTDDYKGVGPFVLAALELSR